MNTLFSVPKPCHENWDAMTPEDKGRFCSLCSKTVTDFTQMSNEQIVIHLRQNSSSRVCGRFTNDQLEEKISINIPRKVLYSQTKFINVFLLALLVSMGPVLFSCKNDVPELTGEVVVSADTLPPPPSSGTTTGMIAYPDDSTDVDSVAPPPPLKVKKAPVSLMGEVAIDSVQQKP